MRQYFNRFSTRSFKKFRTEQSVDKKKLIFCFEGLKSIGIDMTESKHLGGSEMASFISDFVTYIFMYVLTMLVYAWAKLLNLIFHWLHKYLTQTLLHSPKDKGF
jgi:hypothetical protein